MTKLKHKHGHQFEGHVIWISLVGPFHSTSALLHLFAHPNCRDAVRHGWVVNAHCVSPYLYALTAYRYKGSGGNKKLPPCRILQ